MLPVRSVASSEVLPATAPITTQPPLLRKCDGYEGDAHGSSRTHQFVRRRYIVATGTEKHKIHDEFTAVTGYHEKSAIRALNAEPTIKNRPSLRAPLAVRPGSGPEVIVLWEAMRDSPRLRPNAHLADNACRYL